MAFSGVVPYGMLAVLLAAFTCCTAGPGRLVGGWKKHSVNEKPVFEELAHYAISKQVSGREYFDTVLELVDVDTQLVAGTNYRIKFKVAESTCRVTESYSRDVCLPKSQESVKDVCTAVIYDVPWLNERSVTSFTCEGTNTSK